MKCFLYWSDDLDVRARYYYIRRNGDASERLYCKREDGKVVEVLEMLSPARMSKEEFEAANPHLVCIGVGEWHGTKMVVNDDSILRRV